MAYYNTCPDCGANLDPGERCDCTKEKSACVGTQNGQKCVKLHLTQYTTERQTCQAKLGKNKTNYILTKKQMDTAENLTKPYLFGAYQERVKITQSI